MFLKRTGADATVFLQCKTKNNTSMKTNVFPQALSLLIISCLALSCGHSGRGLSVVPSPSSVQLGVGTFVFDHNTVISVEDNQQKAVADWFSWLFAKPAGFVPKVFVEAENPDIVLRYDKALAPEAYRIKVTRRLIEIEASGSEGFLYAFQTLRQTLPSSINAVRHADGMVWSVPVMEIYDEPRYSHRCLKIDVTDDVIPIDELMIFVDYISILKLNHLHFQGYGLYDKDEFAGLTDYASTLNVNIVPNDGKAEELYSCPEDLVSRVYEDVAELAEVAWSEKEVIDRISFNEAVDAMDFYICQQGLGLSSRIYDLGLSMLR